jgi:hypothetical protein
MKVAITGSHGLIGAALAASLTADGHEVVPVGRSAAGVEVASVAGCSAVVNLAGAGVGDKRWTPARKALVLTSRTSTTSALSAELARLPVASRPGVLLSGSAIGYYGDRGSEVLTESAAPGSLYLSEVCVQCEAAAAPAAAAGVRVAQLRTGIVLAPKGGALGRMLPLFKVGLGGPFGSGKQYWSWVSLADEVRAIRFLLENEVSGPVNLTGPEPVTNAELTKSLGHVLHRPAVVPVPSFGPALLLGKEAAHEVLFASQRVVPRVLADAGFTFEHPDVTSALRYATT